MRRIPGDINYFFIKVRNISLKVFLLINIAFIAFVYSFFSSPTPRAIGIAEILIASSLAMISSVSFFYTIKIKKNFLFIIAIFSSIFLILIPLSISILKNFLIEDIARDLIPMLYLTLPVILYGVILKYARDIEYFLLCGLLLNGFVNCLKYLYGFYFISPEAIFSGVFVALILEPSTIFSALLLTYSFYLNQVYKNKAFLMTLGISLGYFLFYHAILINNSRAAHLMIFFLSGALSLFYFKRAIKQFPLKIVEILKSLSLLIIQFIIGYKIYILTTFKTKTVGLLNGRFEEAHQIFQDAQTNPAFNFFGSGWGAKTFLFTTGVSSGFSHNLPLFIFWKSGTLGLVFLLIYYFWLFSFVKPFFSKINFSKLRIHEFMFMFVLLTTLAFNSFFVAGFKHLTYSFLLVLYIANSKILFNKYIK